MFSEGCVTLQSCQTQEFKYIKTGFSNSIQDRFWANNVGAIVQITEPANFPDIFYTIVSHCVSSEILPDTDCAECFRVGVTLNLAYVTLTEYDDCPTVTAYVLLNCKADPNVFTLAMTPEEIIQSPETALVTSSDLSLYVGSVVNIEEHPGNCYQVLGPYGAQTGCPCNYYTVTNAFKDCECCLPPVPEVFVRTTQKPFKNFTRITETECEIRTIEKFAVNYYNYFRQLKYGLQNCCGDHDLDKLWMDMQMVTFNRMQNGTCTTPTEEVVANCPISPLA